MIIYIFTATCEPTTCPDPPACDSCCAECEECTCPPPVTCPPPTECPTCPSTTTPTDDPCDTLGVPGKHGSNKSSTIYRSRVSKVTYVMTLFFVVFYQQAMCAM